MSLLIVKERTYSEVSEGEHLAVIGDMRDAGMHQSTFGQIQKIVPKVGVYYQIEEQDEGGNRKWVKDLVTRSLHPNSHLRNLMETALGRPLSRKERQAGVLLTVLIGKKVFITVKHRRDKQCGSLYTNVVVVRGVEAEAREVEGQDVGTY